MSRRQLVDSVLAVVLTAIVQLQVWRPDREDPDNAFELPGLTSPLLAVATLAVAWRRRAPLAATLVFSAAAALQATITADFAASGGLFLTGLALLYALAAYAPLPRALAGLAAFALAMLGRDVHGLPLSEADLFNAAFFYLLLLLAFAGGLFVRARRHAARLEAERRDREAAIAEERARIARELHDIVAHSVSATVVQAEAAEEVLEREPERARASLHRIQGASREALGEMRRLLGDMRGGEPLPRGVADLEALVAAAREDGLAVALDVGPLPGPVPPGVDLSAFRIVQESLTNARRHAGPRAQVRVTVRDAGGAIEVEVADDGCGVPSGNGGAGLGLVGMRERAEFFGGTLDAGPGPDGGFVVRARLPVGS
jgi:signal transduction histidine kinase